MYVCLCHAVTDKQIKHAVEDGCCSLREVSQCLNVGKTCGRCVPVAREVISDTLAELGADIARVA
ncbi:MAG: bacterioferritin-associated ferredoxin [Fluviicoccus sp.]|uniref:bacterioferritin-associated ferredoxin n=1 Tax=Fluviicoccus sp. TaxID=2003552 RepID=UPI00271A9F80|nr:bacterioferritin-associated ferredoxin [Fluviicoccus sp.]MDO8329852.1 bacterioferritin-associated ferredoxin [Fluviicoccus sp.]